MKLIATKSFRNVAALRLTEDGKSTVDGAVHAGHVHKGAVFSIGDDKLKLNTPGDLQKLNKADSAAANVISLLVHAGAVGDATDAKVVEEVQKSVAEDATREANAAKLNKAANAQGALDSILNAIKGLKPA